MKKNILLLLAIMVFALLTVSCETASSFDTETESERSLDDPSFNASCIKKDEDGYAIVLPISNKSIRVDKYYEKYLEHVTDELVLAAESAINAKLDEIGEDGIWWISSYDGKQMCLIVEVIRYLDNPNPNDSGCGIDHEHIFFGESIIESDEASN